MAGHYMDCAANTDLLAAKKLVLMCIADDADKQSRIGRVGLDAIRQWSGLGRSRALAVVAELVADGYLLRHAAGRIGRQAEFVVFPAGCCPLHGPVAGYTPPADDADTPDEDSDQAEGGSAGPDPRSAVEGPEEGPEEGPVEGPAAGGPLPKRLNNKNNPPTPPANRGAKTRCRRHGDTPGDNCRRCGTNPRGAEARLRLAAAEAAAAEVARIERDRDQLQPCRHPDCDPDTRWRSPDDGPTRRCPECHPDLVIGRPTAEQLELVRLLPALAQAS